MLRTTSIALVAIFASAGCGAAPVRFAERPVVWRDRDRQPFGPRPEERFAPELWDAADNLVFRPAARALAFDTHGESVDVNALDEVPSSSWFENRIGIEPMTPEEVARGACDERTPPPEPPWLVVSGKVDGATAGFVFEDASGRRFLFKADRASQPEQATAADAIGAAIYHAAGYHVPCNRVISFEREWVELAEDATVDPTYGPERPMTEDDLDRVFELVLEGRDGRLRGAVSALLEGEPLGPWDYRGTWGPDLNDVVPHEDRRELRAMRVLSAWVDHWDARQLNTLAIWRQTGPGEAGHVEHYLVDFGDTLGYVQGTHRAATRYGRSQWLDVEHITEDFLTFGAIVRPWDVVEPAPSWPVLGYFRGEGFDPEAWRPNYWNGAFERCTERDAAWMARILARFDERHLRALVRLGRFSDPRAEAHLVRALRERRDTILERWLTRLSPLASPEIERREGAERLCVRDVAVESGIRSASSRAYEAALAVRDAHLGAMPLGVEREDARACVALPRELGLDYVVVRMRASTPRLETTGPLDVHLARGEGGWRVAGLRRIEEGGT